MTRRAFEPERIVGVGFGFEHPFASNEVGIEGDLNWVLSIFRVWSERVVLSRIFAPKGLKCADLQKRHVFRFDRLLPLVAVCARESILKGKGISKYVGGLQSGGPGV